MMKKTDQTRRQLLQSIVAVALAGKAVLSEAEANPLLWLLRTAAHGKFARVTARTLARARNRKRSRDSSRAFANIADHMLNNDIVSGVLSQSVTELSAGSEIEVWETKDLRKLYLQIPPQQETIAGQLTLYKTNLTNNKVNLLLSWPITVLAGNDAGQLEMSLQSSTERGLFRFSAAIGSSRQLLRIRDTPPVLLL